MIEGGLVGYVDETMGAQQLFFARGAGGQY